MCNLTNHLAFSRQSNNTFSQMYTFIKREMYIEEGKKKLNKSQSLLSYQQSVWNHITSNNICAYENIHARNKKYCARDVIIRVRCALYKQGVVFTLVLFLMIKEMKMKCIRVKKSNVGIGNIKRY